MEGVEVKGCQSGAELGGVGLIGGRMTDRMSWTRLRSSDAEGQARSGTPFFGDNEDGRAMKLEDARVVAQPGSLGAPVGGRVRASSKPRRMTGSIWGS